ncbi:DUF4190 domain-containing protein [Actinoplanes sp. CA-030573]|uniref:DUF4190 domain-containing protein n=1 Tax=Actinoplanes sp. CA-030573 TaxID=3239898 RepID=UPI003D8AA097
MTYPYQPPPPDDQPPGAYYHQQPIYPYGFAAPRQTDGLAIASLVVSCAAVLGLCAYGIGGLLGVVGAGLGHAARRRIARNGSDGAGMALAGIIVGWIAAGIAAIAITGIIVLIAMDPHFS